jgi:hypothetical protein
LSLLTLITDGVLVAVIYLVFCEYKDKHP